MKTTLLILALLLSVACDRSAPATDEAPPHTVNEASTAEPAPSLKASTPTVADARISAPGRIVAIGDIHGDFDAMMEALRTADIIDDQGHWIAGDTTLVQTGDVLDRGDDEQKIIDYLNQLAKEAEDAGGQAVLLIGNHETMNVAGDLRYVTQGGFEDFEDVEGLDLTNPALKRIPEGARARMAALLPGGPYAEKLSQRLTIAIVDDTVFAHGGVLPSHVVYGVDELNSQVSAWMRGEREMPEVIRGESAPTWTRAYSGDAPDCDALNQTLAQLDADRMVVGHTVQKQGITSACDGKVWRIDVGMSTHYGGAPEALEIEDNEVEVLESDTEN